MLTFGSLFAGIGGFDLGFERAGMRGVWQVEKDRACQKLLRNKFGVPVYDDVTTSGTNLEPVDLICGGFPCQDVSLAGRREGLAGERSGLWFEFHRIIKLHTPRWVVIENVPGLLSSNEGRDMLTIVSGLAECGYRWSYRILDAQHFGLAQRRRRVFIVASLGNASCVKVLFEQEGSHRDSTEIARERHEHPVYAIRRAQTGSNGWGIDDRVAHTLDGSGGDAVALYQNKVGTLNAGDWRGIMRNQAMTEDKAIVTGLGVRRLTPTECERLQGFPDGWTSGFPDSTRYKMLGNAVAVPCAEWIGRRIVELD